MKLPRNISADELISSTQKFGYVVTRQKGSHIRITTNINGQHHLTIPNHSPIKLGTLSSILNDIASHFNLSKEELIKRLFG
jgi:predicted RNA binding protein YcfA (HicA-like mRNA interferase family)